MKDQEGPHWDGIEMLNAVVTNNRKCLGQPSQPGSRLPSLPCQAEIWIDFDGTITQIDVLDELIAAFAVDDTWRAVEARWIAGEIGSFECLYQEFQALSVDPSTLEHFLQTIPVDPGAKALFSLLRAHEVPFVILSDGIESFITTILTQAGLGEVAIRANRVEHFGQHLHLFCPHRRMDCQSHAAHCKCSSAQRLGDPSRVSIYIGDGRSDLCPARKADVVFAKGVLAALLQHEGRAFLPFDSLQDVASALAQAWERR